MRLFIAGTAPRSGRTVEAVRQLRDAHLPGYELEVVDLYQQPQLAEADRVVAAPTLVRVSPGPSRRVAGDLTDARRVLQGLGLDAPEGAPGAVGACADER
ncbi:circadian clock protein KaiB [Methylobacterium radiodurans]|uniref:Circadian clock protein KaiB n=1 Tax=Methylobacterium radiodurans TaxID=2202828 RepID=A0A2U8W0E3_9HYPH|nr:circadian clock protein KaiB [Methylobacterium radiodurans]